jgi:hypothetical protein
MSGEETVEAGTGTDIDYVLALRDSSQAERVADTREGLDGAVGQRRKKDIRTSTTDWS